MELPDDQEFGVYSVTCLPTGRKYIGSTARKGFKKRCQEHLNALVKNRHYNTQMQNAWNKYGANGFEFKILLKCDQDICLNWEQWYLDNEVKWNFDYNVCKFAWSSLGAKRSYETRRKLRLSRLGKKTSEETRAKMRLIMGGMGNPNYGVPLSEFHKQWLREINTGRTLSEETKAKIRGPKNGSYGKTGKLDYFYGKTHTDEAKSKISKAGMGNKHAVGTICSDEKKLRLAIANSIFVLYNGESLSRTDFILKYADVGFGTIYYRMKKYNIDIIEAVFMRNTQGAKCQ